MNPAQLLEHFDRISEAPDAVARLRRFILDLAVRGKLVEQDSDDEPASELFKRIQAVKASDVAGTRKQAVITKVGDSDVPFPTPLGWLWLRFGLVHDLVRGVTYTKSDVAETRVAGYVPILRANNIGASLNFDDLVFVRQECIGPDQMLRRGDYLIALSSGSKNLVGKAAFVDADHPCGFGGFCGVIRLTSPSLEQFAGVFLSSRLYRDAISAGSRGIGINNLKRETLNEALFPLPPLTEQNRIVAKVNELMALCDQLEAAKNEREARRDRLVAASLNRIDTAPVAADEAATEAQSATLLRDAARFHLDHLPRLIARPEHIKQLRQSILNLAVRGALSASADWTSMPLPLKSAATLQNGYAFKSEWFSKTGIRLLRNTNVSHGALRWADLACLPLERAVEFDRFKLSEGDVVLSLDRPFIVTGTKVARVCVDDLPCLLLQRVGRFQLNPDLLTADYLFVWIQSPHFTSQIDPGRSNGVPHISSKQVESALIVLPPLAEQKRIVAKVDELMALCDQLEAQRTATQTNSRRLLEAVLHEALSRAHMEVA